jgi:hypothetical protein
VMLVTGVTTQYRTTAKSPSAHLKTAIS